MRITTRIHEFLADHISWVQYPEIRQSHRSPSLYRQFEQLSRKEKAWVYFSVFWGVIAFVGLFG